MQKTSSTVKKKKVPLGERSDVDNSLSTSQSSQTSQSGSSKPTGQRPPTGITAKPPRFSLAITSTPRTTSSRKPSNENENEETPRNPPPRTVGGRTPHPRYSLPRLSMGDDTMLMDMSMSGLDADFLDTDASDVEESGTGRKGGLAKGRSGMVGGLMTPANSQEVEVSQVGSINLGILPLLITYRPIRPAMPVQISLRSGPSILSFLASLPHFPRKPTTRPPLHATSARESAPDHLPRRLAGSAPILPLLSSQTLGWLSILLPILDERRLLASKRLVRPYLLARRLRSRNPRESGSDSRWSSRLGHLSPRVS
jgi:hypothetical protein